MKTEKLYYSDSHMFDFTARVLECIPAKDGWNAVLDRTAFFPEGGGQLYDTGTAGTARVLQVHEREGEIYHLVDTPLEPGSEIHCSLDREQRLRRMQAHSGEHIVSGWAHKLFGVENVGFHMGEVITIDFSEELTAEQLQLVERRANETVRENVEIRTMFPAPEELDSLEYRSKLDLRENVRLVEIPGVDICACCAPHVSRTGEVGLIKLLTHDRHRGGVRLTLLFGMDAFDYVCRMQDNITAISNALSAKRLETAAAVERLAAEKAAMAEELAAMSRELVKLKAESCPETEGSTVVFENGLNNAALRELVNLLCLKSGDMAAAFSGSDEEGYSYIIASRSRNLRVDGKAINAAINGRGGGSPEMIQGKAKATAEEIRRYFEGL